jgi:hypothetical protein
VSSVELTPEQRIAGAWLPGNLHKSFALGKKGNWVPFRHWIRQSGEREGIEESIRYMCFVWVSKARLLPDPPKLRHGPLLKGQQFKLPEEELLALFAKVRVLKEAQKSILHEVRIYVALVNDLDGDGSGPRAWVKFTRYWYGSKPHARFKRLSRFLLGQTDRHKAKQRIYNQTGVWRAPER